MPFLMVSVRTATCLGEQGNMTSGTFPVRQLDKVAAGSRGSERDLAAVPESPLHHKAAPSTERGSGHSGRLLKDRGRVAVETGETRR